MPEQKKLTREKLGVGEFFAFLSPQGTVLRGTENPRTVPLRKA
jgi:hypothetical protein